jgi:DNA-directed RNA polymerase
MIDSGITQFSMIHDSYGCPAPDVILMRAFTNEEFHKMHSTNLLADMREELMQNIGIELPNTPEVGVFNIDNVLDAEYFFQ